MVYQGFQNMLDLWSKYADDPFHNSPPLVGSVVSELKSPKIKEIFIHSYQALFFIHCHLLI